MLVMENAEEIMQILERFTKLKQRDIPKELDDYLCYVAKTGDTVYKWTNVKYLFREKLVHVIKEFHDTTPNVDDLPQYPNVDPFNYETLKTTLLERLDLFNAAPFTIQRLCELLTDPKKQYGRVDKFMRALEKNILVVSTIEPGRKPNESENGDSLDSVVNGELSLDVNVDIDMDNESIFTLESQSNATSSPKPSTTSNKISKSDDDSLPSTKKPKLDLEENLSSKPIPTVVTGATRSESESDDTSDDSDSQEGKEYVKNEATNQDKSESKEEEEKIPEEEKQKIAEVADKDEPKEEPKNNQNVDSCVVENKDIEKENTENASEDSKPIEGKTEPELEENKDVSDLLSETKNNKKPESTEKIEESLQSEINTTDGESDIVESVKEHDDDNEIQVNQNEAKPEEEKSEELQLDKSDADQTKIITSPEVSDVAVSSAKIPEQMSIEESTSAPSVLETETCLTTAASLVEPVALNIGIETPTTTDQPMEENLESAVTSMACTNPSTTAANVNEVVMQSESDMATDVDPIKDEKGDLAGMDIDDTSQEEAMDQ